MTATAILRDTEAGEATIATRRPKAAANPKVQARSIEIVHSVDTDTPWNSPQGRVHPRTVDVRVGEGVGSTSFLMDETIGASVSLEEWTQYDGTSLHVHAKAPGFSYPAEDSDAICHSDGLELFGATRVASLEILCRTVLRAIDEARAAGWVDDAAHPAFVVGAR